MEMEGNDYKIRTMARDLEEVRKPPIPPSKPPVFREVSLEIPEQVSDKTAEVRKMDAVQPAEERKLEEILHEARRRIEVPPLRRAPRPVELEDLLPIEEKIGRPLPAPPSQGGPARHSPALEALAGGPPPNLPTAEIIPYVEKAVKGETPEEILGLPQQPIELRKVTPSPTPLPPKALPTPSRLRVIPTLKFALLTTFLSIVLIATAFGVFKLFSDKEPLSPPPPLPPKITEQPLPQALLRYDEAKFIEVSELSYDAVKSAIDALQDADFAAGSLLYIPIKYSSEKEIRYLTAAEFFGILHIDLPPYLTSSEDFSLFLYIQEETMRLGFVMTVLDTEAAVAVMKEWEKTIVEDLGPLMFGAVKREEGAQFRLGSYKNAETHFINLPIPTTSVDWILTDTHLIVATSKDAARAAVDRVGETRPRRGEVSP